VACFIWTDTKAQKEHVEYAHLNMNMYIVIIIKLYIEYLAIPYYSAAEYSRLQPVSVGSCGLAGC